MSILVINGGSQTIKAALFDKQNTQPAWHTHTNWENDFERCLKKLLKALPQKKLTAIGHRVVHGGELFQKTTPISPDVKKQISEISYLAPLHNPINLLGIEICEAMFPDVAQFAAFDTAFHTTLDAAAYVYPIPYDFRKIAIRRYGFHGISHEYCSKKCAALLGGPPKDSKIVVCHLGAGSSLCAVKQGRSVDTTMGMTPLEGLMMSTRCGSIDPGILLFLLKEKKYTSEFIDSMLNEKSGLLGISGLSGDMREIEQAAFDGNERAQLALDMFTHRLTSSLGSMIAVLGGIDALVFTAGIGENSAYIREKTCAAFGFLGLSLDHEINRSPSQKERVISSQQSTVKIFVIPTQEEWAIAHEFFERFS